MRLTMRQVDRDELVWKLYSAMRHWNRQRILDMFDRRRERRDHATWIGAEILAAHVAELRIYASGATDPLTKDELRPVLAAAIEGLPGAVGALWKSDRHQRALEARATAANLLADALEPFAILVGVEIVDASHIYGDRAEGLRFPDLRVAPHALRDSWP